MGQMDCVYSYWVTRREDGFGAQGLAALRDLVPVLGLAIKSAAQVDIARTLGRVYLGRDAAEQVLRGRIARGVTERINTVLWFSDVRGSTAISESIGPDEIIPFLNDYAQASIDAIHDAGGEVLKLIGDGVLAMFTAGEHGGGQTRGACAPSIASAATCSALNARRTAEARPVTTAHVGLHVGEVFYGNIGSEDRLDFTVVGPAVNEVSRIASMCRSVDRELLTSSAFRVGLDAAGRELPGVDRPFRAARHQPRAGSLYARSGHRARTRSWRGRRALSERGCASVPAFARMCTAPPRPAKTPSAPRRARTAPLARSWRRARPRSQQSSSARSRRGRTPRRLCRRVATAPVRCPVDRRCRCRAGTRESPDTKGTWGRTA